MLSFSKKNIVPPHEMKLMKCFFLEFSDHGWLGDRSGRSEDYCISLSHPGPWVHILNILCGKTGSRHTALLLHPIQWLSWGRATMPLNWGCNHCFFMERHFYFKNLWQTWFIQTWEFIWQTFSKKMNKVSLSLQGKQQTLFVANGKTCAFNWKLNFGKLVFITRSGKYVHDFFQYFNDIFHEWWYN